MKTVLDLVEAVRAGKTFDVQFDKAIEEGEGYLERGMRARLTGVADMGDDIFVFTADVTPFAAHNKGLESANYFDKAGIPTLTASESGHYPEGGIERVYCDKDPDIGSLFVLLDGGQTALYAEYVETKSDAGYVSWLEQQLMSARATPAQRCWRHLKRGSVYAELSRGKLQAAQPVAEGASLVSYRGADGQVWFRPEEEFEDGRFVEVTDVAATVSVPSSPAAAST